MPSIQTTKKRLHYSIFRAISLSQTKAVENGVSVIGGVLFAHCLIESCKSMLQNYYDKKSVDDLSERLLSFSISKSKKKVEFTSVKISKSVHEIIGKAHQDIDKVGPEHVLYMLMKDSEDLKLLSAQYGVTMNSVVEMINKENSNKENTKDGNDVFGSMNSQKKNSQQEAKENPLSKYCIDFTQKAKDSQLPPVFCREKEMDQIITTLMKKNKANPLLIGEPGVGKTALIEGLAQRFVSGNVPDRLKGFRIISMPLSSIVQGTTLRGQFEERLDEILKFTIKSKNVILFIDEVHTIIGAGSGNEAGLDAGNIMKPYLARGDIKCIGATTFDDYYKYMKRDKALSRRFQRIFVPEPDDSKTIEIIKGLSPSLESFHSCKVEDGVLEHVVRLCRRFITDRFFPDKAIDCLDHSCAKSSLYSSVVTKDIVEHVVSEFSDVPITLVGKNDVDIMNGMETLLSETIIGNNKAVEELCYRIKFCCATKKCGGGVLSSIILYGPSGVGKKNLVYELSERLYGKGSIISINGSEYAESHSISRIVGSPPGYIGHDEETFILREVRRRPHTVILVKNPEQMHPIVMDLFKQIFNTGSLTDVHGMTADFSNSIVIFSVDIPKRNVSQIGFSAIDSSEIYSEEFKSMKLKYSFLKSFNHAIGFTDVDRDSLNKIIDLEMKKFESELKNSGIIIEYDESVLIKLSSFEGTPSEVRSKVRGVLELSLSKKINGTQKLYRFIVSESGDIETLSEKEKVYERSSIQS